MKKIMCKTTNETMRKITGETMCKTMCKPMCKTTSKIKICGLSCANDIKIVNHVLPDFIGFVFAPSRRRVDAEKAVALKKGLDPRIEVVGVFVNESVGKIAEMYQDKTIDLAQLHGDEDDEYINQLKRLCGCRVIKAVGVGDRDALPILPTEADYLLFDTLGAAHGGTGNAAYDPSNASGDPSNALGGTGNASYDSSNAPYDPSNARGDPVNALCEAGATRGGTGRVFNWNVLKGYLAAPYFLAGGLNAYNISDAINTLSPFCVDVSSGVETNGLKDEKKVAEFVSIVRGITRCY